MTDIGKMDRIGQLQASNVKLSDSGGAKDVWTDVERVWCSKPMLLTGRLAEIATKASGKGTYTFECHYRLCIKQYCRMVIEGVTYDITEVFEKGRRDSMMITATVTK